MNKSEFLERANAYTVPRYGVSVTDRMLRDWITEKLIPKIIPVGRKRGLNPEWELNCKHYRRILQICHVKDFFVKAKQPDRFSLIRIDLWLSRADLPFDLIREDISDEYQIIRNKIRKPIISEFDPEKMPILLPRREKALSAQMGELSSLLPDIGISTKEKLAFMQKASFGYSADNPEAEALLKTVEFFGLDTLIQGIPSEYSELLQNMFTGGLGNSDEMEGSAEEKIKTAPKSVFENARENLEMSFRVFTKIVKTQKNDYSSAFLAVKRGQWRLMLFIGFFNAASKN